MRRWKAITASLSYQIYKVMQKTAFIIWVLFSFLVVQAQTELEAPLPEKFAGITEMLTVHHFPSPVFASEDPDVSDRYLWKHNSSLFSPYKNITVLEGGAYIFYNDQWNLRVSMSAKEFSELFNIPNQKMKAGEPYTFVENWRYDSRLIGGWAMWYVIGIDSKNNKYFGVGKLHTVGEIYTP